MGNVMAEFAKSFLYAFVIQQMMLRQNYNVLDFSHHMHINAAIVILRVDVRHCPSLMVVSTMAFEEIELRRCPFPTPDPVVRKAHQPTRFPHHVAKEIIHTGYKAVLRLVVAQFA
ncbi:hypothetical protein DMI65_14135 [Escherichia coli]|nr:hypothetical protein [Escherichia coli]